MSHPSESRSNPASGRKPRFAIIGAGMSGLLAAIKLRKAGCEFTAFEKAASVGGTWRENTYPGIACDVPSHLYSCSFALDPDWSYMSSPGGEIPAYFEGIAERQDLERSIRFRDPVVRCDWQGEAWEVESGSGFVGRFDWVIAATGILHHLKRPDIPGLEDFAGDLFHSAQWDHSVPLGGRRIGVIGNGSSGFQITGTLAPRAGRFVLFQRTAQWVVPVQHRRRALRAGARRGFLDRLSVRSIEPAIGLDATREERHRT